MSILGSFYRIKTNSELILFLRGIVGCIARMVEFFTFELFDDPTFLCIRTQIWTIAELSGYLMAACMPSFRALKRKFLPNFSLSKLLSSVLTDIKRSAHSWRNSTEKDSGIYRTRELVIRSSDAKEDQSSVASTAGFRLQTGGYVEMNDWQVSNPDRAKENQENV